MLRISLLEHESSGVTLRLEGSVSGPWVEELKGTCQALLTKDRLRQLNLDAVTFIDEAGVTLLSHLLADGVEFSECSPFLREQLKI